MNELEKLRQWWQQRKALEAMQAKDVGLGGYNEKQQAPGYGVLQQDYMTQAGQQPAGYGVLQQGGLTNVNATGMAADGRTFNDKAGEYLMAMGQMGGSGQGGGEQQAPEHYLLPTHATQGRVEFDLPYKLQQATKKKRPRYGLLGEG